jgi:hypothetical protein
MIDTSLPSPDQQPVVWVLVAGTTQARVYECQKVTRAVPEIRSANRGQCDETGEHRLTPRPSHSLKAEAAEVCKTTPPNEFSDFASNFPERRLLAARAKERDALALGFISAISTELEHAYTQKSFTSLAIVAPPRMLGKLKELLAPYVLRRVVAEVPKELIDCQDNELMAHLEYVMPRVHATN